ncbi:MAG TPA: hypothetical protein VI357_08930 [Mycobacteriales bacterium]
MTGPDGALERRYRRLLAWYPRAYRAEHEDEMLGVLLAGAAGRRPGLGERADLVLGGLRIRARHAVRAFPGSGVADALAAVSLLVPVLLLPGAARGLHEVAWWLRHDGVSANFLLTFPAAPAWALWLVAAVLGLLGRRRAAAVAAVVAAAALSVLLTVHPVDSLYLPWEVAPWVLLSLLGAVAAVTSAGARRGLAWLGALRYGVLVAASVLVVAAQELPYQGLAALWLLPVAVVLACRPATRTGRWVLALLALPGTAYLIVLRDYRAGWAGYGISAAVAAALICLLWTVPGLRRTAD